MITPLRCSRGGCGLAESATAEDDVSKYVCNRREEIVNTNVTVLHTHRGRSCEFIVTVTHMSIPYSTLL